MKSKIAKKMLMFFLLVSMVPFFIFGFVAYRQNEKTFRGMILDRMEVLAGERAGRIEHFFTEQSEDLNMLAEVPVISVILEDFIQSFSAAGLSSSEYGQTEARHESFLTTMASRGKINDVVLIGLHGDIVFTLSKGQDLGTNLMTGRYHNSILAQVYAEALKRNKVTISRIDMYEPAGRPVVFLAGPIKKRGVCRGVIAIRILFNYVNETALDYAGLGETGETVVTMIKGDRIVWAAPTRHDSGAAFTRSVSAGSKSAIPAQQAAQGTIGRGIYTDYRDVPVLAAWRPIPSMDLGIVIKIDEAECLKPIRTTAIWFLIVAMGMFLSVLCVSLFISRSISNPILSLIRIARRMAEGDLSARADIRTSDEISDLSVGFNTMAEKLETQTENLKKNEERFRAIFEATSDCILVWDRNYNYLFANQAAINQVGTTRDKVIGKNIRDGLGHAPDFMKLWMERIDKAFETGETFRVEDTATINNTVVYSESVISPLRNTSGEVFAVGVIYRDVTDRRKAEMDIREKSEILERQTWLRTGLTRLNEAMRGDPVAESLVSRVISEICTYIDAQMGAFYCTKEGEGLRFFLLGSYAYTKRKNLSNLFKPGEGLVGQAVLEKRQILLKNVPEDYVRVTSGLGERIPRYICVTPFLYEGDVKGVIEVGSLNEMTDLQLEYIEQAMSAVAYSVQSVHSRTRLKLTLEESQRMSEELQVQQEELRTANEELEDQTRRLQSSEEKLKSQQEELQVINEELEEKNELLERQKAEVETARRQIEDKAGELALAGRYKSEFLANMSHELRTPLNSLLLLAQGLAQNKEGNLTEDQVEAAKIVYGSGNALLNLINEILDLSKIEAGRVDLHLSKVMISDLSDGVNGFFGHICREKGLTLEVITGRDVPEVITSDQKRLEQVIRNLVSNAVKFTEEGGISVSFTRPDPDADLSKSGLNHSNSLAVTVKDTGIGITPDQQKIIFEAFQQADGGTSRKYGGTGLGLSISRELTRLLGGEIQLKSEPEKGSTFTLFIPIEGDLRKMDSKREVKQKVSSPAIRMPPALETRAVLDDDRETIHDKDAVILVIEDDLNFAGVLLKKCREKGFKCITAPNGEMGLELARKYMPGGVILDIRLPGMDGYAVLNELKEDTRTRHIPVHIVSVEEASTESLRKGAVGHAVKPLSQESLEETFRRLEQVSTDEPKRVLLVEDDTDMRRETARLIGNGDALVDEVGTGSEALEALRKGRYDCMVLDLGLPDMDGKKLLENLKDEGLNLPPVIVHTARDLTGREEMLLREHAESIVIKDVRSQERLLDEVSLFLHRVVSRMPENMKKIIHNLYDTDELFKDKKVLVVDDDMRTTFAVSRLLSERGIKPLKAENGRRALSLLRENPDIALVLMDIMMPVMDGYETMKQIRSCKDDIRKVPIIALTAKAMPEDREKCLAAGADDYLTKPVDAGRLISMMRVWMYR